MGIQTVCSRLPMQSEKRLNELLHRLENYENRLILGVQNL